MGKGIAKRIVFSVLTVLAAAGAVLILRDSAAHFEIYGQRLSVYTEKILLSGDEINDLEELEINLKKLPCLKFADLGTYRVYADDSAGFRSAFPGVEFRYGTYVQLYGVRFNTDAKLIDLSGVTVENTKELSRRLDDFTDLKKVSLGRENTVPAAEKAALCTAYPEIDFDIVATFDIYGMTVREDVTSLDLSGVGTDSSLSEKLSLLPLLTYVNMQGSEFSFEEQLALVRAHPGVEFDWDARLGGKVLNSMAETADISGIRVWDLDTLRCQLELFPRLTYLDMSNCGVSNEDMAVLRDEYKDIKIVWRLYMGKWSLKTDAVAFSVLIYDYSHKRLTSRDIEVLKYCTDLQALDLGHQALTDLSVIGDYLPELRILILADNSISDLTPLAKLKHLHYLEFFVNRVTDVTPLAECRELVDLNISYNHGLSDITPLLDLPLLERLWLEHCNVSYEDAQLLMETYPDARVVYYGKGSVDQGWRGHDRYFAMIDMYHNNYMSELFSMYDGLSAPPEKKED